MRVPVRVRNQLTASARTRPQGHARRLPPPQSHHTNHVGFRSHHDGADTPLVVLVGCWTLLSLHSDLMPQHTHDTHCLRPILSIPLLAHTPWYLGAMRGYWLGLVGVFSASPHPPPTSHMVQALRSKNTGPRPLSHHHTHPRAPPSCIRYRSNLRRGWLGPRACARTLCA